MTEKVKIVIGFYFLLLDFESRGHSRYSEIVQKAIEGANVTCRSIHFEMAKPSQEKNT